MAPRQEVRPQWSWTVDSGQRRGRGHVEVGGDEVVEVVREDRPDGLEEHLEELRVRLLRSVRSYSATSRCANSMPDASTLGLFMRMSMVPNALKASVKSRST